MNSESAATVEREFIGCFHQPAAKAGVPRTPYAMPAHAIPPRLPGAIPVAANLNVGVDPASLSNWRNCKRVPSAEKPVESGIDSSAEPRSPDISIDRVNLLPTHPRALARVT